MDIAQKIAENVLIRENISRATGSALHDVGLGYGACPLSDPCLALPFVEISFRTAAERKE